jgi:putative membrane protein
MQDDGNGDPRFFFAAERTLLAWIRTGLGLVGLGFVVAKFHLVVRFANPTVESTDRAWSVPVGVGLSLLGAAASGVAAWQHGRFCRTLAACELPRGYRMSPGITLGYGVSIVGLILATVIAL